MFELEVYSNGFRILEQPADIRRGCGEIYTSTRGFRIISECSPAAGADCLFLRGTSRYYDKYLIMNKACFYSSMRALEEYCQFVSERLVIKLGE